MNENVKYSFNRNVDDDNGEKFEALLTKMYSDLEEKKILKSELDGRLSELYDSVPFCWLVSTFRLEAMITEQFPTYYKEKWGRMFEVNPEKLNDEEIESKIKSILKKFKNGAIV